MKLGDRLACCGSVVGADIEPVRSGLKCLLQVLGYPVSQWVMSWVLSSCVSSLKRTAGR